MTIDLIPIRGLKAEGVPLSPATIWRRVRDGTFPAPCYPSPRRAAWVRSEIEAWKAGVVAARDAQSATDAAQKAA